MREIPLFADDGRPCGIIYGDVLEKPSRHKLLKPLAWAFDASVITQAHQLGVKTIRILDNTPETSGSTWEVDMNTFMSHKGTKNYISKQWYLTLDHWSKDGKPSKREAKKREASTQLKLNLI